MRSSSLRTSAPLILSPSPTPAGDSPESLSSLVLFSGDTSFVSSGGATDLLLSRGVSSTTLARFFHFFVCCVVGSKRSLPLRYGAGGGVVAFFVVASSIDLL